MASSYQRRENAVELFHSSKLDEMDYIGNCTVDIKVLSKMFVVDPCDKEANAVEISLYSSFVQYKNILCHVSFVESNRIALIFPTIEACEAVYDILMQYQAEVKQEIGNHSFHHQIRNQILIPLLKEAKSNRNLHEKVKNSIINMLEDIVTPEHESNLKSEFNETYEELISYGTESLNEPFCVDDVEFITHPSGEYEQDVNVKHEPEISFNMDDRETEHAEEPEIRQCKTEVVDEVPFQQIIRSQPTTVMPTKKIVISSHFLIIGTSKNVRRKHELIIFISDEKSLCYPYFYEKKKTGNRFSCINCQKAKHSAVAHLRCDNESGEYFIELGLIKHVCSPVIYEKKPGYYVQPYTTYSLFYDTEDVEKKKQISLKEDKPQSSIDQSINNGTSDLEKEKQDPATEKSNNCETEPCQTTATVDHSNTSESPETLETEIVIPEPNTAAPNRILEYPDFELQIVKHFGGAKRYRLIVFASKDHKLCYVFFQQYPKLRFVCRKCQNFRPNITAFIRTRIDGEKYVLFDENEHYCVPELYSEYSEKCLSKDEYSIMCTLEGNIKPIIYDSNNKNLCYIFSMKNSHINLRNTYVCEGCESTYSAASLIVKKDSKGEYQVSWKSSIHSCKPKPLTIKFREKVLLPGRFKFFVENDAPNNFKLLTFPFDDKNIKCRIFKYSNVLKVFCCTKCLEFNHVVIADAFINLRNEEYIIESNPAKHVCQPYIYSNLDSNNFVFKFSSRCDLKKFNQKLWDENTLILAENFEFQRNRLGNVNGLLIIFALRDRGTCYKYFYESTSLLYLCQQCKVSAKVFVDEDGKYFVKISSSKHRCQRVLYRPEKTIIRKPDYIIIDTRKPIRLIVFTSPSHEECYVYTTVTFKCQKCIKYSISVHASFFKDENDEECVFLSRKQHLCQPQKFENVAKKLNIKL